MHIRSTGTPGLPSDSSISAPPNLPRIVCDSISGDRFRQAILIVSLQLAKMLAIDYNTGSHKSLGLIARY
jgi:hypothetical protein